MARQLVPIRKLHTSEHHRQCVHHWGIGGKSGISGLVAIEQNHGKRFLCVCPIYYLTCLLYLAVSLPMPTVQIFEGDIGIHALVLQRLGYNILTVGKLVCQLVFREHHKNVRLVIFILTV